MTALARVTSIRLRPLKDRIADIEAEIKGVKAQSGITQFDQNFLKSLKNYDFGSDKQRRILTGIEKKVFGYCRADLDVK